MKILRRSTWKFNTSSGTGISLGVFAAEKGMFVLDDIAGHSYQYTYSAFGATRSFGIAGLLRIPKLSLPKIIVDKKELGGSLSTTGFDSKGALFLTESFNGEPSNPKFLNGGTLYLEGAAGYLFGGTGSIMMLGINPHLLTLAATIPNLLPVAIRSALAVLLMAGDNEGLQDSVGVP